MNEWTPVSESFPKDKGHYIVCFEAEGKREVGEAVFYPSLRRWYDPVEEYFKFRKVTHWMSFPEPPEVET